MKRKMVAALLTAVMTFAMSATAFAETTPVTQDTLDPKQSTTVSYEVKQTYTVTIPETVTFTSGEGLTPSQEITANSVLLDHGNTLNVKVSSLNGFKMVDSKDTTSPSESKNSLTYKIEKSADVSTVQVTEGSAVLSVQSGAQEGSATLNYSLTQAVTKAGSYSDTLTFTVSVDGQTPS